MRFVLLFLLSVTAVEADDTLQATIDAAIAGKAEVLRLPAGEHRLSSTLRVRDAHDLTIEGHGATLVFTNWRDSGLHLLGCSRVTLRNLTIDFDPLPFTQGTILSISEDRSQWEFEVHAGYPSLSEEYLATQAYVYDPETCRLRRGIPDIYPRGVEALSERRGRITINPAVPGTENARAGDLVVLNIRDGEGVYMNQCEDLTVENVTVLTCPGIAFIARYMFGDNVFRRLAVRPGPPPAGATYPRLMSSCADAFNFAYAARGPVVERCRFRAMGDDSINLHGPTFAVCAVSEREVVLGRPYGGEPYERMVSPGDIVQGLRVNTFEPIGEAVVERFEREREVPDEWRTQVQSLWPRVQVNTGSFFRVQLAGALAVDVGDWVASPTTSAAGFAIRDNVIEDVGRGDVIQERWGFSLAGITVFGRVEREATCPMGNRDIVISGNSIDGCPTAGISVSCTRGVGITGNTIAHTNYLAGADGDAGQPIEVEGAEDVVTEGNELSGVGEPL